MTSFTEEQVFQKWDDAPPAVRAALVSEQSAAVLHKALKDANVSDSDFPILARLTSWTLLGLLPMEQFAKELAEQAKTTTDQANALAAAVTRNIITSVRAETRDFFIGPIVEDVGGRKAGNEPALSPDAPSLDISFVEPAPTQPQAVSPVAVEEQSFSAPSSESLSEPAPMFLHQETESVPVKAGEALEGRNVDLSSQQATDLMKSTNASPQNVPSAQVQLGDIQTAGLESLFSQKEAIPEAKIVQNYSEFEVPKADLGVPIAQVVPEAVETTPTPPRPTAPEPEVAMPMGNVGDFSQDEAFSPAAQALPTPTTGELKDAEPAPPLPERITIKPKKTSRLFGGLFQKIEKLKTLGKLPSEIRRDSPSAPSPVLPDAPPARFVNYSESPAPQAAPVEKSDDAPQVMSMDEAADVPQPPIPTKK